MFALADSRLFTTSEGFLVYGICTNLFFFYLKKKKDINI